MWANKYLLLQNANERYSQANSSNNSICGTPYTNQFPKLIMFGLPGKHL